MPVQQKALFRLVAAVLFWAAALNLSAQGTAISYQGQLAVSGAPANTNYDFRFAVFSAPTNGAIMSAYVTNSAVPVSNGLFTVIIDFGPGIFNGTPNGSNDWLDIAVRPAGTTSFTTLTPRQPILPVPYALFATSASNVLGTIASTSVSGTYSNTVNFSNSTNTFIGTFTGNGVNLTNLNASQITSGTLADARLGTNVALLNANQRFTGTNTFAGTNFFTGVNTFTSSNFFTGPNSFTNNGNYFTGTFAGNGANLTNLNVSQATSGTLADNLLSTNVALLNGNQRFTGTNTFNGAGIYNGTNTFNSIGNYYGINTFNGAGIYNGTNTFNGPEIYNGINTFSNTGVYTGTNTFNGTGIYNGTNTFNSTGNYNGSNTFNGAGTYNGVNTFSNFGNSFSGSFFGNGLVGWVPVSAATQQAVRDHGYMLIGPGLTTVTLPASAGLTSGDIVRVSGAGGGGWLVAENTGQSIIGNFARYTNSFLRTLPGPTANGYDVAASADGVRMYIVGSDITGVFASSDSGSSWSQVSGSQLAGDYVTVACSADGKTVYAEPYPSGTIVKSINGGLTWASTGQGGNGTFIACTANGSTLFTGGIACSGNGTYLAKLSGGVITVSTNGGVSFNISVPAPATGVSCLAASSDCTKLVAGVNGGLLYASLNQGATWTTLTTTNLYLTDAWMSPDGSKLAATANTSGVIGGGVFSSSVSPQPNVVSTNSTIAGSQGSAVELQYIGNGQFMPVSSTGLLWAN